MIFFTFCFLLLLFHKYKMAQQLVELLTSRVESSHESKTLNFKVLFIKLEYNWTKIYNYASQNASLCESFFGALIKDHKNIRIRGNGV